MADSTAGLRSDDEIHPRRVRHRPLRGDDLDRLAIANDSAKRRQPSIYLGGDAPIANVRVDRVRKVDHCRAARQPQDLPLRREHVHLVGKQVDLDAFEKLLGGAVFLQLDQV